MLHRSKPEGAVSQRESWTRLSPDERRAQIMEVAERLFATRANADFSVAEVARGAGVTPGLVYHYFVSKERLIAAVCELRANELLQATLSDRKLGPLEQIEHGVKGYLNFVEQHHRVYLNLFRSTTATQPEIVVILERTRLAIIDHFAGILEENLRNVPQFRLALRGYIGFTESIILDWLANRDVTRADIERLCFHAIGGALAAGLPQEVDPAHFTLAYQRRFGL